jgi:hypothetical protein
MLGSDDDDVDVDVCSSMLLISSTEHDEYGYALASLVVAAILFKR